MGRRRAAVKVWLVDVNHVPPLPRGAVELLGAAEQTHLDQLRGAAQRWSFAVARVAARRALALVTDVAPGSVRFTAGPRGRPTAAQVDADMNLARSGSALAIAVSTTCRVGVDIERIDQGSSVAPADTFSAREQRLLRHLSMAERAARTRQLWTLKEALAKLSGAGLGSARLDDLDLAAQPVGRVPGRLRVRAVAGTHAALGAGVVSLEGVPYCLAVAATPNRRSGRGGAVVVTLHDGTSLAAWSPAVQPGCDTPLPHARRCESLRLRAGFAVAGRPHE